MRGIRLEKTWSLLLRVLRLVPAHRISRFLSLSAKASSGQDAGIFF